MHIKTQKSMPDYLCSKIYKIVDNTTGNIYIGSTTQALSQRLSSHVRTYKSYLNGKGHFITSFEVLKNDDFDIVLIEEVACETKEQLHSIERRHIDSNTCVNKYRPSRSTKQYYEEHKELYNEQHRQYYQKNSEEIKESKRQYRKDHKDEISQRRKLARQKKKEESLGKINK